MSEKREIPPTLRKVLAVDAYLTDKLVNVIEKFLPLRQLKVHYKLLEYSCHGIPWLAGWLAFIWIVSNPSLYQMQVNFYLGLLLDIVFIAVTKAIARRRRPAVNDDPFAIGPDKYSFPSGHASRSAFIVYFFMSIHPLSIFLMPPLLAWVTSVCLSRILMRRHYLLDITAGLAMGILNALLISFMYLEKDTCAWIVSTISDEKLDGGEYHV